MHRNILKFAVGCGLVWIKSRHFTPRMLPFSLALFRHVENLGLVLKLGLLSTVLFHTFL